MEVFLLLDGIEISAHADRQERTIVAVASGNMSRIELCEWLLRHTGPVAV